MTEYMKLGRGVDVYGISPQSQYLFHNKLPSDIIIYRERSFDKACKLDLLTSLAPFEKKYIDPKKIDDKDRLVACHKIGDKVYPVMEPYTSRSFQRHILFGTAVCETGYKSYSGVNDMSGVWLHNCIRIPLFVYYQGDIVAKIQAYDGKSYKGGSAASLFFTNNAMGLKVGSEISFSYALKKPSRSFKVMITNENITDIFLGKISGGEDEIFSDNAIYRVNSPNILGIKYY